MPGPHAECATAGSEPRGDSRTEKQLVDPLPFTDAERRVRVGLPLDDPTDV